MVNKMEDKLISSQWLINDLLNKSFYPAIVKSSIESAPAVNAVSVVRCKDCIRRYDSDECPMCHVSGGQYYEYTSGNGYCDRGERKDNG